MRITPTARLTIKDFPARPGDYFFFIYLLEESSLKQSLRLIPVITDLKDRNIVRFMDDAADQLIGRIPEAEEAEDPLPDLSSHIDELGEVSMLDSVS